MFTRLFITGLMMSLGGCVNLYAGISQAEVKPFYDADLKQMVCCHAKFTSGKNAGSVVAHIVKNGDDFTVDLNEQQIDGSAGITAANVGISKVAQAVSDTAITVEKITKGVP